jgi:hypothetical protein
MREPLRRALVLGWVMVVVVMAIVVIWQVMWSGPPAGRPDRAQVWGTLWAAIVIVPPVVGWGWQRRHRTVTGTSMRAEVDAAAERLAEQTLETWSRQIVERGIQAPAPVRVRWRWAADDVALPRQELTAAPSLVTDPGPLPSDAGDHPRSAQVLNSGLVTRLHDEVYARLRQGRLVLIGGPGAGKTGAMILLLLEALRYRKRMPETPRTDIPVPVWLTLGSWDPSVQTLRDWVLTQISRDHPYLGATDFGPDAIAQLFDTGRIALFLDGLDEMPEMLRRKAVELLTAEAAGRRMVITSRPGEFRQTIDLGHRQLPYTAVIELRPIGPKAAAEYLLEGQIGAARQAWQPVVQHLLADPEGVLAQTLNTPLTLSLARAAYAPDDPRGLLTRPLSDGHELRVHLLDQILIAAYPDVGERVHATYWLGWLAHKMDTQPNGPIRELRWWQVPSWIPRWRVGLTGALVGGLSVSVAVGLPLLIFDALTGGMDALIPYLLTGLVSGLLGALLVGLVSVRQVKAVAPRSMGIRWPKTPDLRSVGGMVLRIGLFVVLASWLVLVVGFRLADSLAGALSFGLIAALIFGLILGVALGVPLGLVDAWHIPLAATSDVTPRLVYQRDVRSHLVSALMGGIIGGIIGGIFGMLSGNGLTDRLGFGLVFGLILGLTLGPVSGLVSGFRAGAAPSLKFAEIALFLRGRRVRFMPLLESALDRQVLRQAGAVYQFRHADLQDRLAERYEAGLMQCRATQPTEKSPGTGADHSQTKAPGSAAPASRQNPATRNGR